MDKHDRSKEDNAAQIMNKEPRGRRMPEKKDAPISQELPTDRSINKGAMERVP
jgi:hypothetical protein